MVIEAKGSYYQNTELVVKAISHQKWTCQAKSAKSSLAMHLTWHVFAVNICTRMQMRVCVIF